MKYNLFFVVVFLIADLTGASQKPGNFHFDLGLTQNHKGFFRLFDGVIDAGGGYNQELFSDLYGGFEFHMSFLNRQGTTNRTVIYKPRLNLHYCFHLSEHMAVIPVARVGYSMANITNKEYDYREMQSGWNSGGELRLLWKRKKKQDFFVFGRVDYIYLDRDNRFTRLEYYRNVYLTSFGIGIRIKKGNQ